MQESLYRPARSEQSHEVSCEICKGNRLVCVQNSSRCPVFLRAKSLVDIEKVVGKTEFFGPSPPGVFLGSYGYPNLLAGPLVPVLQEPDPSLLDAPDRWLDKSIDELLRYRFGLVRGKSTVKVQDARNPDKTLSLVQEIVMSESPTDQMSHGKSTESYPTQTSPPTKEPNLSIKMEYHSSTLSECSPSVSWEPAERAGWSRQNGALPRLMIFYPKTCGEKS